MDIIDPRKRLPLHYLCERILICEVRGHRMITSVNAFPLDLPYKRHRWPLDSINVLTRPAFVASLVGCKYTKIYLIHKILATKFSIIKQKGSVFVYQDVTFLLFSHYKHKKGKEENYSKLARRDITNKKSHR